MKHAISILTAVSIGAALLACSTIQSAPPPGQIIPRKLKSPAFRWIEDSEGALDLIANGRRVLRYVHAFDPSTPERLHETYKCYHHVFDEDGQHTLTKGSGGLYTHHRGLFIGWNRLTVGDREYDFWHMKDVTQRHVETTELAADEDRATQTLRIDWCDNDNGPVITERRQLTVHRTVEPGTILLLDFESQLTPVAGDVLLNGDPEHAGFQFRAHNDVADGPPEVKATYLFHAEGVDPRTDFDLPWVLMSYGLNGKRYHVQHLNHPDNPDSTVYSAYRDYGRFGAFAKTEVKRGATLALRYRILITEGDPPTRETCHRVYEAYGESASTAIPRVGESEAGER